MRLDGVCMDAVIELGQCAVQVPGERQTSVFILLEALELLDQVELELDRYPGSKFKGNVPVCIGAAVTA